MFPSMPSALSCDAEQPSRRCRVSGSQRTCHSQMPFWSWSAAIEHRARRRVIECTAWTSTMEASGAMSGRGADNEEVSFSRLLTEL